MPVKIIYIAGLGHSGSTILDMSLGAHSQALGLGELANMLKAKAADFEDSQFNGIPCSCGGDLNTCTLWSGAKHILINNIEASLSDKCKKIINYCTESSGGPNVLVDSSKGTYDYLKMLQAEYDLRVIFLIRDCRSWCYSRHSRHGTNIIKLAYKWLINNLKIKKFLVDNRITFKQFGYEEIALFPEIMLKKICEFVEIDYEDSMLVPNNTKSHIIRGNVSRLDENKREGFLYDGRWLSSNKLSIITPFILPSIFWNNSNVYSNFISGKSEAFGIKQDEFIIFGNAKKEELLEKELQNS